MSKSVDVVIAGGGIAGYTVAAELRQRGFDGSVAIIDPEGVPYDRPPLSKEYLQGEANRTGAQFQPESWYGENNVEIIARTVEEVNAPEQRVLLDDGTHVSYDKLVLATGGKARRGNAPGFNDERVIVLRTREDADKLRAALGEGKTLGIIGAGLIGAEVASTAVEAGTKVVVVDPSEVAIVPAVGIEIATRLHELHAAHGVDVRRGFTSAIVPNGEGFRIEIEDEEPVVVDNVLLCIGITADESLATSAGLECDNGVLVDTRQRTADPHIWAIGDCARTRLDDGHLERRHEHWDSALQEASAAAASILGEDAPTPSASWFWSDRYGHHVEGVGDMTVPGTTIVRADDEGRPEIAFRLNEAGELSGAASVDDPKAVRAVRRIIDRGIAVDPEKLADRSIPLKKLMR